MQVLISISELQGQIIKKDVINDKKMGNKSFWSKKKNQEQTIINVKFVCTEVKCVMICNHSKHIFKNIWSILAG